MDRCVGCGEDISMFEGIRIAHSASICVANLRERIEAIESKLGAALSGISSVGATVGSGRHDATSDHNDTQQAGKAASGPPAAPSVSAEEWRSKHSEQARRRGWQHFSRACDLAAAVTEWASGEGSYSRTPTSVHDLAEIVTKFVRGEPLP